MYIIILTQFYVYVLSKLKYCLFPVLFKLRFVTIVLYLMITYYWYGTTATAYIQLFSCQYYHYHF